MNLKLVPQGDRRFSTLFQNKYMRARLIAFAAGFVGTVRYTRASSMFRFPVRSAILAFSTGKSTLARVLALSVGGFWTLGCPVRVRYCSLRRCVAIVIG